MVETAQITRYEQVKRILDHAAAGGVVDYDGRGHFWHLPLSQFLTVEIYGIRMIAPPETVAHSCCHGEAASDPVSTGRGARSGLIRGLRGQPPFDGSQFPPLPWGGQPVPEEKIGFISDWIDDGCSADDHQTTFEAHGTATKTTLEKIEESNVEAVARSFEVYEGSPNEYTYKYGELKQRMNLDCMPESEVEKLRWAFRELYRLNKWPEDRRSYNNMALIHQNHCQHGWERFLPWHRVYLYEFEQVLQDVCPGITMPYWDWTMTRYCPERPEKGLIIPPAFKAYLTKESIAYLTDPEQADPALPKEVGATLLREMVEPGSRYTSQTTFFADVAKFTNEEYTKGKYRKRFIDALLAANSLWYPLRYPSEYHDPATNKPVPVNHSIFHYHYPTAEDMEQILALRTFRDFGGGSFYDDSFGFLDQNPHNTMHIWTGGQNPNPAKEEEEDVDIDGRHRNRGVQVAGRRFHTRKDMYSRPKFGDMLSNLTASYDPVFWPIHVNIDRLWHEWQQRNPHSLPVGLGDVLTPWSYTIADTLDMSRFGYEYVKSAYLVPVGLATPVGRFVSKPISIPDTVRGSFQRAEVRLHRVPQLPRSCFIRVFLNLADANASTSIEDSHYAGYLAIFGHGSCIGGPGHCDLPPGRPRLYDQRPRDHNTPRNHRVNITKTAKRLLDAGATSLQITLVVIGADYCADDELLRLEGVSLDFLD
ncbi:MAG: tyrosinase family protein [Pyrinomonadaceae bacterium]